MAPDFFRKSGQESKQDFRSFLTELSGQEGAESPAQPRKEPSEKPLDLKKPDPRQLKKFVPFQSKEAMLQKKMVFPKASEEEEKQTSTVVIKRPLPPKPPLAREMKRTTVPTSPDDDAQYLMAAREKAPEAPITEDSAFLPRIDEISHPMLDLKRPYLAPPAPQPTIEEEPEPLPIIEEMPLIEEPLREEPRREEVRREEPRREEPRREEPKPIRKDSEKIALSHISIRPKFNLEQLFETIIRENASDLHLATASVPAVRVNGELVKMELPDLDLETTENLLLPILSEEQRMAFEEEGDIDFSFDYLDKARFRINYFRHHWGIGATFRFVPNEVPKMEQLGLPGMLKGMCRLKQGLILLAGPSGSGKSTTIAALIDDMNTTRKLRIITLENPIEYLIRSKMSLISQREIGTSASSFTDGLWSVLREDPDIIVLSELWEPEEIRQVLKISETGHLVICAIRTVDCTKAVERLVDAFPADEQDQIRIMISETLAGVIAQRLIPRADGRGRVLACEILLATTGLATTVRDGKLFQIPSIIQTGRELGMQTMDQALVKLIEGKLITPQTAKGIATDPRFFQRMGIRLDD